MPSGALTQENFGRRLGYVCESFTGEFAQFAIEEVLALRRLNLPVVPFALYEDRESPELLITKPVGEIVALNVPFAGLRRSFHRHIFAQQPMRYLHFLLSSRGGGRFRANTVHLRKLSS